MAAAMATVLAFATTALPAAGGDVSTFLVSGILVFAWMGCALLASRPKVSHPMSPLLCTIELAITVPVMIFGYMRGHAGPLVWFATVRDHHAVDDQLGWAPVISLGGLVLPLVFLEGEAAVAAVAPGAL
jgi:hypothetical protein